MKVKGETMAVIGVDYDEFEPETYRGIYVYGAEKEWTFTGGTPTQDMSKALAFCRKKGFDVVFSSSVDHFIMDGGDLKKE